MDTLLVTYAWSGLDAVQVIVKALCTQQKHLA